MRYEAEPTDTATAGAKALTGATGSVHLWSTIQQKGKHNEETMHKRRRRYHISNVFTWEKNG